MPVSTFSIKSSDMQFSFDGALCWSGSCSALRSILYDDHFRKTQILLYCGYHICQDIDLHWYCFAREHSHRRHWSISRSASPAEIQTSREIWTGCFYFSFRVDHRRNLCRFLVSKWIHQFIVWYNCHAYNLSHHIFFLFLVSITASGFTLRKFIIRQTPMDQGLTSMWFNTKKLWAIHCGSFGSFFCATCHLYYHPLQ